jgi:hypothetical protein
MRTPIFKLLVARTLQVHIAEIEPASDAVTRSDFLARFSDHTVSVEAVVPAFNAGVLRDRIVGG